MLNFVDDRFLLLKNIMPQKLLKNIVTNQIYVCKYRQSFLIKFYKIGIIYI